MGVIAQGVLNYWLLYCGVILHKYTLNNNAFSSLVMVNLKRKYLLLSMHLF